MFLKNDERGFIFTLDGTLAVLISILGLAAVTAVGSSTTIYEQQGYRGLGEYADQALQVLEVNGAMDEIENLISSTSTYADSAELLAENQLREILPTGIRFRMKIGGESNILLDNVYPTYDNHDAWRERYENAEDIVRAVRISIIEDDFDMEDNFEPVILYLWRGEGL
ncbi:hypothetical protein AKJ62_04080 [candidate division MSBL1 archaeon SCGC-AAA259D14]|uniref:Uncharacterized protein n=1 Tax=candidate division MSBL1 archaeon SCGC-AAA259D14 TaxID=1698261 RepID=A0A133U455_9EURY|nr:hypothetical protein AKJ62_04080 [candidate division MSBL1 archaeon SCGC-AAA259D14]